MNAFEKFLDLRKDILRNDDVKKKLLLYTQHPWGKLNSEGLLTRLGEGYENIVFALGSLIRGEEVVFLATREEKFSVDFPEIARKANNNYIGRLLNREKEGVLVPRFCGGVGVKKEGRLVRSFLLVEDFTKCGTIKFDGGRSGEEKGLLDGKLIAYDFDTLRFSDSSEKDFLAEEYLLLIEDGECRIKS